MTVDLSTVPLVGISAVSKQIITAMLNPKKVLSSDNGLPRDWRGLAHLLELNGEIMSLLVSHSDPTTYMLTMLEKNKKNITIKNFQTMMEEMDRWDIIDDTEAIFQNDAVKYLEQQQRAQVSADLIDSVDQEVLTLGDVHRLSQGLETQYYDAFLLYADEDVSFVNEMVQKLEAEYKLKLCLKDRDLVGGVAFEHEAVMKLISERCNRLLIIISPNFLKSSANKFFLNYAQALSIEKRQRKLIPCIYESCELPFQLKYISTLDYNRRGLYNFWDKLHDSIKTSNSINTNNITQRRNTTKEVTEVKDILFDKHDNIPQNSQKTNETSKYLQQKNKKYTIAKINDAKALNVDSKKNKTLLRWEKITNWKMKQTKQSGQLITETAIQNLPSVDNLDSLDLSNTDIYENKKKNLFSKFTKKKIGIKA
ncbi:Myeloid differentiation primary response protein MyD88 [Camponotus floridanus]|uniref:Myeloid differentiation primary response protein MyD88 n=1 Tax=Camponotus floridanus TaxID=104421 RepID=E2AUC0_CAMFO|nr:myeloid differentiation primary response protein MyD88 [Camponotus floridanus]EFN62977.1 Myeloid differentiation primary response protein MyD88 [Camponotus floridanus]